MCEIIQWVIQSDLAAVWDEIAEFILEGKLILTNPGGTVSVCGGSGITISAGIVGRSEHTIVKQSKPGGKRTIKSCFLCRPIGGIQNFPPLYRCADRQKNRRIRYLCQMVHQGSTVLIGHVVRIVHFPAVSDKNALHQKNTVRVAIYNFSCLVHVTQNLLQTLRLCFHCFSIPVVEKT